jgi:hypothetical protein
MARTAHADSPQVITKGDLAVSLPGEVDEFTPTGTFVQHLVTSADGLAYPTGTAFDGNGNLYVTDFSGNKILKRDALTGAVTVFADDSTLGNGQGFDSPESIVFNKGYTKMYVSGANRFGSGGGVNVIDTATGKSDGYFPLPSSNGSEGAGESDWLAFDSSSNLYMTNENPSQGVMRVDQTTGDVVQPSFVSGLPTYGYAISFDKNGNLWLGDTNSILEYDRPGNLLKTITNSDFSLVFAAVFNATGDQFYAGDLSTGEVFTYDLSGSLVGSFSAGSSVSGLSVSGAFVPPNTGQDPVLMIHGIDATAPYGIDCATTWDDAKTFLRAHGFGDSDLLSLSYYDKDSHCDRSIDGYVSPMLGENYFEGTGTHAGSTVGHTAEAAIEHLGYHLAWFIYDNFSKSGQSVDVLAHSMGGLMIRYALAEVSQHNPAFPPMLLVDNAVTLGTPHGGSKFGKQAECLLVGGTRECSEMRAGSAFLTGLEKDGWNPQGAGGTDWTAIGSDTDQSVAADRAVGTNRDRQANLYFGACHKVWYPRVYITKSGKPVSQDIPHDEYMHDGNLAGGMGATNLETYSSGGHCGAPLVTLTGQPSPMGVSALALSSHDY